MEKSKIFIIAEKDLARNIAAIIDQLIPHIELFEIYDYKETLKFLYNNYFVTLIMTEFFYKKLIVSLGATDIKKTIVITDNDEFIEECEKEEIKTVKRDNLEIGFKNLLGGKKPKEKK